MNGNLLEFFLRTMSTIYGSLKQEYEQCETSIDKITKALQIEGCYKNLLSLLQKDEIISEACQKFLGVEDAYISDMVLFKKLVLMWEQEVIAHIIDDLAAAVKAYNKSVIEGTAPLKLRTRSISKVMKLIQQFESQAQRDL